MSLYNGTLFINFWPPIHPFQSFENPFTYARKISP